MRYYEESFAEAIAPMDAQAYRFVKLLFRKGNPEGEGQPAITSTARRDHSMLGMAEIPDLPRDVDVVTEEDLRIYAAALERNGFFGPSSWYMNHPVNTAYAETAHNDGYLDMPVLFLTAQYDFVCECVHSPPGRAHAQLLPEAVRRDDPLRPLDGPGKTDGSQRRFSEMACDRGPRHLAATAVKPDYSCCSKTSLAMPAAVMAVGQPE